MYIFFSVLLFGLTICLGILLFIILTEDKEYIGAIFIAIIMATFLFSSNALFNKALSETYKINLQKAQILLKKEPKLKKPFEHFMEDNIITSGELEKLNDYYLLYIVPSNNNKCKCK